MAASPPESKRAPDWSSAIEHAQRIKWEQQIAPVLRLHRELPDESSIAESYKYWWVIRPYGRRFLAWELLGVLLLLLHALGTVLWYGEFNAQLHNHRRCVAGGLGDPESIRQLERVRLLAPTSVRILQATAMDIITLGALDAEEELNKTSAALTAAAAGGKAPSVLDILAPPITPRPERRWWQLWWPWRAYAHTLRGLECRGRCPVAAMDVFQGIVSGAPQEPTVRRRLPVWLKFAGKASHRFIYRERLKVCRPLHPSAPPRGAKLRECLPRRRAANATASHASAEPPRAHAHAHAHRGERGPRKRSQPRLLSQLLSHKHRGRCRPLHPPPQCARMCRLVDFLRIANDLYNLVNFLLIFVTAYRVPRRRRAGRRGSLFPRRRRTLAAAAAAAAAPAASAAAELAHVAAPAAAPAAAEPTEHTYEFSPWRIVRHRLTRPYLPLQLFLACPTYTLVVHLAGVYSPKHAIGVRVRETLLSRVKADPQAAWRFLVRTGLAHNLAKIVRALKLLKLVIKNIKLVLKMKTMAKRCARAYRVAQERVALKQRVRTNWRRIRSHRRELVHKQRHMMGRLTDHVRDAAARLSTIKPRASLKRIPSVLGDTTRRVSVAVARRASKFFGSAEPASPTKLRMQRVLLRGLAAAGSGGSLASNSNADSGSSRSGSACAAPAAAAAAPAGSSSPPPPPPPRATASMPVPQRQSWLPTLASLGGLRRRRSAATAAGKMPVASARGAAW